ncbi:carbohydrate ABC transporter permease [Cohnella silvisoli]|uniref:Sugar ABC transporter permease n=1 Tax=Cohnella silvisoli TaxID=2873699 RepID=A0ABV1KLL9_9BACL|nr:sugar ABC transporter permease [Cohnella silvisoli]MCD9020671.1 sugar ABC transporter permease [Cohnella silvisoli]
MKAINWKRQLIAYSMAGPMLIVFYLFVVYPLLQTFAYSLYDYSGFGSLFSSPFVGLGNFSKALLSEDFHSALWKTVYLAATVTIFKIGIGFVFAVFLYRKTMGWKFFQILLYLPAIVPVVVSAALWKLIYEGNFGLLNNLLKSIGLNGLTHYWLNEPATAMNAMIVVLIWVSMPLTMLILFSYMLRIPKDLLECARIDGASSFRIIRTIIFPLVLPAVLLLTVLSIAESFKIYDFVLLFTNGGPAGKTMVLGLYAYQQAFNLNHYGYSSAVSLLVLLLLALISIGVLSRVTRHVHEL